MFASAMIAYLEYSLKANGIPTMLASSITLAGLFPLVNVEFEGEENLPGIARGYVIKCADVDDEAKPVNSPSTALAALTIVGSHTLATGKYFTKMYSTLGKGTLKFEPSKNRDFENFSTTGLLFYPSTKKEALAMSMALLGQDLIILLEENSEEPHYLQVGTKKLPARITASGDWGTELNGEKGITFNIEAFHGKKPVYLYDGNILTGLGVNANENPAS